jgi:hypothetical protein
MPLVVYPPTLPAPSVPWESMLRPRAARSGLAGMPGARRRWRDPIEDVVAASWVYSADEMATWREWWATTLVDGQLWFAAVAPGYEGFVDRVMRFRPATVRVQPFGGGGARVSAQLEVRGRSAPPSTVSPMVDLFWARFENDDNRDEVGNWIYDLDANPDYVRQAGQGAPGSEGGCLRIFDQRRFYIQAGDNEGGGTSPLLVSSFLDNRDWLYAVSFNPGEIGGAAAVDLGGFNPSGGPGQALFSLTIGYDSESGFWIEARIDDAVSPFYLYYEGLNLDDDQWVRIGLRKMGAIFLLLIDDEVVLGDPSYSGNFAVRTLISFGLNRSENGNRSGYLDEARMSYSPAETV